MPMELPLQNIPNIYTRIQKICEYYEVDMYSDFLTFYSYEIFCYNTGNDKLREEALWTLKL